MNDNLIKFKKFRYKNKKVREFFTKIIHENITKYKQNDSIKYTLYAIDSVE